MSGTADFGHATPPDSGPAARPHAYGPEQPSYWTVSTILRMAREETGLGLRDVAAALRIRASQLHAIEDGRYHELPGTIYAVGFVRSYAEYLGLDADEVVERFRQEIADLDRGTELVFPAPVPEGRVPGGALLLLATLLALAAYGSWYYMSSNERNLAELMPALPDRLAVLLDDGPAEPPGAAPAADPGPTGAEAGGGAEPAEPPADEAPANADAPAPLGTGGGTGNGTGSYHGSAANAAEAPLEVAVEAPVEPVSEAEIATLLAETPGRGDESGSAAPPASDATGAAAARGEDATPSGGTGGADTGPAEAAAAPERNESAAREAAPGAPRESVRTTSAPAAAATDGRPAAEPEVAMADSGAAPPPPPPAEAAEDGRAYGLDEAGRIVIRATADSWVQVNDRNGSLVMTRVLRPGDSYRVPDTEGLELVTGNAGGLRIFIDGNEAPPLGAPGTVLRDIPLDAERLRAGTTRPN